MYDYFLGGSHNFQLDREAAEAILAVYPDVRLVARANRAFLGRAVRYLAEEGIDQFLDIGSGLPTVGSVHEIAHQTNPAARVVYVDNDPVAVHHSLHVLRNIPGSSAIQADARDPVSILRHPEVIRLLDFTRPIGLLMLASLHFVTDDEVAYRLAVMLREALAPGSFLVVSHATYDGVPEQVAGADAGWRNADHQVRRRWRAEIEPFLEGFELVEPGLVYVPLWRPESRHDLLLDEPERSVGLAGVGRKPGIVGTPLSARAGSET
jgi:SAM-dependent methyltransferase